MRRLAALVALVLAVPLVSARADPGDCIVVWQPDPVTGQLRPRYQCGADRRPSDPGSPGAPGLDHPPMYLNWQLTTGPDGPCIVNTLVPEPPDPWALALLVDSWLAAGYQFCPGVDPGLSPATFAASWWEQYPLPVPVPVIPPGQAVAGWPSYLQTGSDRELIITEPDTPFGPLEVHATATFDIDWGDQTSSGPHESVGGPYPDGDITHVYQAKGRYTIVVTAHWTGTWQLGGASGDFPVIDTIGTIDAFEVTEVQAIITQ